MRSHLKRAVERALVHGAGMVPRAGRRRGATLVLAYHNVVPAGERPTGDRSLHLPQAAFAAQLDEVRRLGLRVVPLDALREPDDDPTPRVVITFDDAYRGALTAGVAELAARDLPATVFVAPAFIGGRSFWWDDLAGPDGLSAADRAHALDPLRGVDTDVRRWAAAREGAPAVRHPPHAVAGTEAELGAAAARGIALGAHSWSHPNLTRLEPTELEAELARPLEWLDARFPAATVRWLSYPYGLESPEVGAQAARAGYHGALRVSGGWASADAMRTSPHRLPRLNVPAGISREGFALRLLGLFAR